MEERMSEENIIDEKAEYDATFAGSQAEAIRAAIAASPRPLSTGLANVDRMLDGGFDYGKLYVLASAPAMGKTTLALQMATSLSAQGHDVLYVALEQDREALTLKGVSRCTREISEVDALTTWQLKEADREDCRAHLSDGQLATLELAKERHAEQAARLKFIDRPTSIDELERLVDRHERLRGNTPCVVLDYLQLLSLIGESDKQKCLSISDRDNNNVMRLKKLAFKHKIPILVLTSVCSTSYYTSVSLESLNHAGGIENTADVVLGLQPSKYSFNDSRAGKRAMAETMAKDVREMSLSCVKNRDGKFGKVDLIYKSSYSLFEEMK